MTSLSDFWLPLSFTSCQIVVLTSAENCVSARQQQVPKNIVLRALRTIPRFIRSVKCFQINGIIKNLIELHRIGNKEITRIEKNSLPRRPSPEYDEIERNQRREVTHSVAQCDFKSWFFFIFIIILDISFILLPHTAFFLQQREEKKIKCSKKEQTTIFRSRALFLVCSFPDIFLRLKETFLDICVRSRFLISILLLENGMLKASGIVYK